MIVLEKWGGSRLKSFQDLQLISKHLQKQVALNNQVILVISAFFGYTDFLINKYHQDQITILGEQLSSKLLSLQLFHDGLKNRIVDVQELELTVKNHQIDTINEKNFLKLLDEHQIIIIPGFQGVDEIHQYVPLDRGGSDETVIYLGNILQRNNLLFECHLFKDVPGIYVNGVIQKIITIAELQKLSKHDFKVLSKRAIELICENPFKFTIGIDKELSSIIIPTKVNYLP